MSDLRREIETAHIRCAPNSLSEWIVTRTGPHAGAAFADWPELVELAQKILAADRAWKNPCGKCRFDGNASSVCRRYRDFESRGYCSHCSHDEACHAKLEELTDGK